MDCWPRKILIFLGKQRETDLRDNGWNRQTKCIIIKKQKRLKLHKLFRKSIRLKFEPSFFRETFCSKKSNANFRISGCVRQRQIKSLCSQKPNRKHFDGGMQRTCWNLLCLFPYRNFSSTKTSQNYIQVKLCLLSLTGNYKQSAPLSASTNGRRIQIKSRWSARYFD